MVAWMKRSVGSHLELGAWSFPGVWSLGFGDSLVFGVWSFLVLGVLEFGVWSVDPCFPLLKTI